MGERSEYTRVERALLTILAVVGLLGVNGAFVYGLFDPAVMRAALRNPVSLAFMAEAFVLMLALAYLLTRWRVAKLGPLWFIVLSLVGSMAFALPAVLLWPRRRASTTRAGSSTSS